MRITYELNEKEIRKILEEHFGGYDSQIYATQDGRVFADIRVDKTEEDE